MAVVKGTKKVVAKILKSGVQGHQTVPLNPNNPAATDIKVIRENARYKLATIITCALFILLLIIEILIH